MTEYLYVGEYVSNQIKTIDDINNLNQHTTLLLMNL